MRNFTPEDFAADRVRLLTLLRQHGILFASPTQPVLSRDGSSAKWMLDSLPVTLTREGVELAGRCLISLLQRFDGTQLATYGVTGIPLLTSCVLQSQGRYHGLVVRKERKSHGSCKLIEGRIDPKEPVIIVDDSVSSGISVVECSKRLEDAGLRVEGAVCLVRFGWYGGFALMQERGYHMEALYDIWEDFISYMADEEKPAPNPTKCFPETVWLPEAGPDGLHPCRLARLVIDEYLRSGRLLGPPQQLDATYDGCGGVWVSVRSRENIHLRHAREGFWHFPGEVNDQVERDVVLAALKTAAKLPAGEVGCALLRDSAIAVTFFSPLQESTVGDLDNDRYGIVVRSKERPGWMGGALPRMPGIVNEWQQFEHARRRNARLVSFEPYRLYRHDLRKVVEPGIVWQPSGVSKEETMGWDHDPEKAGRVAERAYDLVRAAVTGTEATTVPLPDDFLPGAADSIFVSIYAHGSLRGCMGSSIHRLDDELRMLVQCAMNDRRFPQGLSANDIDSITVRVSVLYDPLNLGPFSPQEVIERVRLGQQALMVYQGGRSGVLLPEVAVYYDLSAEGFVQEVIDKAGITRPPYNWCRWDCVTWLVDSTRTRRLLDGGFPVGDTPASIEKQLPQLADLFADYMLRHQRDDGTFYLGYSPYRDRLYTGIDLPRLAHAGWVLARAASRMHRPAIKEAGERVLAFLRGRLTENEEGHLWLVAEEDPSSIAEVSFYLLALAESFETEERKSIIQKLAATLWSRVDIHGRIATHRLPHADAAVFQDYFPGQALLALARASAVDLAIADLSRLQQAFRYYRHRFTYRRHFGTVSWLMQAFAGWWHVTRDSDHASFVFEMADWLLGFQQTKTGGFINDHQSDAPGYTTAVYVEGLGAAARLAGDLDDTAREKRYLHACADAFRFLDRLVIQDRDRPVLPNPAWAIGGVRPSLYRQQIRIDFVQHALSAVLELLPLVCK